MTAHVKIGTQNIVLPQDKAAATIEEIRDLLKFSHPEVKDATFREGAEGEHRVIEFLPKPGRKG
jgi:hypothetical protein